MTDSPRKVIHIRPSIDEAIKPSELIQITGHQTLSLNARRAISVLWHNAHRQGVEPGKRYTIALSDLRTEGKKGNEWVDEAIEQLMKTLLRVKLDNGKTRRVQFLGGNDMDDPGRAEGMLTYSFDPLLIEILQNSYIWGRIAIPVLMAFGSKYAISLYEHVSQWASLDYKTTEDYTLAEFRQVLGVEDDKYPAFGVLNKHVIEPALVEINGLAPFNVTVLPIKSGKRVTDIKLGWWPKTPDELKESYAELQRPRVGRKQRLQGRAETVVKPMPRVVEQIRKRRTSPDS